MRVVGALDGIGRQRRLMHRALDVLIVDIPDRHTIMANLGDVAFIEKLETTRDRQQRLHVEGDKGFTVVAEPDHQRTGDARRSEEHTSELQSLMRNSYAVVCLKKKRKSTRTTDKRQNSYQ